MSDKISGVRGGSCISSAEGCQSAFHYRVNPSFHFSFSGGLGFRVVKETKPKYRVLRGGGWFSSDRFCRPAGRYGNFPSHRFNNFGFRVVKETKPNARVLRGGGWYSIAGSVLLAYRSGSLPLYRYDSSGFRVVKETKFKWPVSGRVRC